MSRAVPDPECILREKTRAPITCLCYHPTRDLLFVGNQQGFLNIWDRKIQRIIETIKAHENEAVLKIFILPDDRLLTHGRDGGVHIWCQGDTWNITQSVFCRSAAFCACLPLCVDGELQIALPTDTSSIEITACASSHTKKTLDSKLTSYMLQTQSETAHGMCMCLDSRQEGSTSTHLFSGFEDGKVIAWDLRTRRRSSILSCFKECIMCMDYNSEINKGACGSVDESVIIWTFMDGKLSCLKTISITNPGISAVTFRSDGKILALGGWDSQGRLIGLKKGNTLAVLSFHSKSIQCVTFSPDNTLALGSKDGAITCWSLYK